MQPPTFTHAWGEH
jgi:isovaleryl-CoA dehydrogenase